MPNPRATSPSPDSWELPREQRSVQEFQRHQLSAEQQGKLNHRGKARKIRIKDKSFRKPIDGPLSSSYLNFAKDSPVECRPGQLQPSEYFQSAASPTQINELQLNRSPCVATSLGRSINISSTLLALWRPHNLDRLLTNFSFTLSPKSGCMRNG